VGANQSSWGLSESFESSRKVCTIDWKFGGGGGGNSLPPKKRNLNENRYVIELR
jgi:hypothetical protein